MRHFDVLREYSSYLPRLCPKHALPLVSRKSLELGEEYDAPSHRELICPFAGCGWRRAGHDTWQGGDVFGLPRLPSFSLFFIFRLKPKTKPKPRWQSKRERRRQARQQARIVIAYELAQASAHIGNPDWQS